SEIANADPPVLLVKSGNGTLTLGNGALDTTANTYAQTTFVHAGTLNLNRANGTDAIPADLMIDGGAVRLMQSNQISDNSNVTITSGLLDLNGQTDSVFDLQNLGGTILTNGGSITVLNSSTLRLAAGVTTASVGSRIDTNSALVSGGVNSILAGAT